MAKKLWQLSANDTVAEEADLVGNPPSEHAIEVPQKFAIDGDELTGPSVQGDGRVMWEWTDGASFLHVFYDPATDTFSGGVEGEGGMSVYKEGLAQAVAWAKGSGGTMTIVESNNQAGPASVVATGETAIVTVTAPDPVARKSDVVVKADAYVPVTKTLTVPEVFEFDATYMTDPPFVTQDGKVRWEITSGVTTLFVEYDPATDTFKGGVEDEGWDVYAENLEEALAAAEIGGRLTKSAEGTAAPAPDVFGTTSVTLTTSDPVARKSDLASLDAGAIKSGTLDPARLPAQSFSLTFDGMTFSMEFRVNFQLVSTERGDASRVFPVVSSYDGKDTEDHDVFILQSPPPSGSAEAAAVVISGHGSKTTDVVVVTLNVDGATRYVTVGSMFPSVTITAARSIRVVSIDGTFDGCLVAGTMVLMADGSWRRIEDVGYGDTLLTWDREAGRAVAVRPSWIMRPYKATHWYECWFASGRTLCTTGAPYDPGHRFYSLDTGRYEYERDAIGHRVLSVTQSGGIGAETRYEPGEDVLESVACIPHRCTACNIITEGQYSLIADGVLTSCRLSNPGMSEDEIAAYWARLERSRKPREV